MLVILYSLVDLGPPATKLWVYISKLQLRNSKTITCDAGSDETVLQLSKLSMETAAVIFPFSIFESMKEYLDGAALRLLGWEIGAKIVKVSGSLLAKCVCHSQMLFA